MRCNSCGRSLLTAMIGICFLSLAGCAGTGWSDFGPLGRGDLPVDAVVDSVEVTYTWTPPTTGTPVEYYECEWDHDQQDIAVRNKRRFTIPDETRTRLRVRGVDAEYHRGPYSRWSAWFPGRDAAGDTIDIHDPPVEERR